MPPGSTSELNPKQAVQHWWQKRWSSKTHHWGLLGVTAPTRKTISLHANLRKAESAVLVQIRTGRIGLASFLNKVRVPDFPSPICQCGQAHETAAHVIAHCEMHATARRSLQDPSTGRVDINTLVSTKEGAQRLARWFIRLRILPQFNLADELLYEEMQPREGEG
jgi:hypothetical protein